MNTLAVICSKALKRILKKEKKVLCFVISVVFCDGWHLSYFYNNTLVRDCDKS